MKYFIYSMLALLLTACNKFETLLSDKEAETGLVQVQRKGGGYNSARLGEEIEVFAKVGQPAADLKFFIGDAAVTPLSRKSMMKNVVNFFEDNDSTLVPVEVFTFKVPENAKIGVTNVYCTVNGNKRPPLQLTIMKPDILFPGKVTVSPFIITPTASMWVDGPIGTGTMANLVDIAYDRTKEAMYTLENYSSTGPENPGFIIRQIKNNMITTLGGGGTDVDAVNGSERALIGRMHAMILGPDGKLYLGIETGIKVRNFRGIDVIIYRPEIIRFDPETKQFSKVAGGAKKDYTYHDTYSGIEDGKENATMLSPSSLTFDANGNLYFLDYTSLLRKITPDGTVSTLLGKLTATQLTTTRDLVTNLPVTTNRYSTINERTDGFGDEVRFQGAIRIVFAGNGKLYAQESGGGWPNMGYIREINPDTKEASTIVGRSADLPPTFIYTGTFKEVELKGMYSFDVDFDGNIVFSTKPQNIESYVYKMDLQQETIVLLAGGGAGTQEEVLLQQPGNTAYFRNPSRIVFDKFGELYTTETGLFNLFIKKIELER